MLGDAEQTFGPVDFLVCNAGIARPGLFIGSDVGQFREDMDLNFFGTLNFHNPVERRMAFRQTGRIAFTNSVLGFQSTPGFASYTATKYAVRGLVDSIYEEMSAYGVSVHLFMSGTVDTPGL